MDIWKSVSRKIKKIYTFLYSSFQKNGLFVKVSPKITNFRYSLEIIDKNKKSLFGEKFNNLIKWIVKYYPNEIEKPNRCEKN